MEWKPRKKEEILNPVNSEMRIDLFHAIDLFPADHEEEVKCLNNRALVSMRLSNHEDVVNDCTRVLERGKDNVKVVAKSATGRIRALSEALDDMCSVMKLDPSREPVSNAISRLL